MLGYIYNYLKTSLKDDVVINCDMGNMNGASTVPVSCTVTDLIPDICLFSNVDNKLTVIELTIPFELNIESAHERKCNKYSSLLSDIEANGISTEFIGLEIGARGFINSDNEKRLKQIFKLGKNNDSFKNFKLNISKLSINSSFVIFTVRNEPEWDNLPLSIWKLIVTVYHVYIIFNPACLQQWGTDLGICLLCYLFQIIK